MSSGDREIFRILLGNQIAMMGVLQTLAPPAHARELETRVFDIKDFWRSRFNEEVGFSAALGDLPRGTK